MHGGDDGVDDNASFTSGVGDDGEGILVEDAGVGDVCERRDVVRARSVEIAALDERSGVESLRLAELDQTKA